MSASAVRPKRPAPRTDSPAKQSGNNVGAASVTAETPARTLTGFNGNRRVPPPVNEPVKTYAPGSTERDSLKDRLRSMAAERADIPLIIGGQEVHTGELAQSVMPHNHRHVLAQWHRASADNIDQAVRRGTGSRARLGELGVGRPGSRIPQGGGASCDDVEIDPQRRHDARAVEDGVPGRDRRGL